MFKFRSKGNQLLFMTRDLRLMFHPAAFGVFGSLLRSQTLVHLRLEFSASLSLPPTLDHVAGLLQTLCSSDRAMLA